MLTGKPATVATAAGETVAGLERLVARAATADGARAASAALGRMVGLVEDLPPELDDGAGELVDTVLTCLCEAAPEAARAEAARSLAALPAPPPRTLRTLARDRSLAVSGPILARATALGDDELAAVAREGDTMHRLAIAQRRALSPPLSDALLESGEVSVVHSLALNDGARFSSRGFDALVRTARDDERLHDTLRGRADLPATHLRAVVSYAKEAAQARVMGTLGPADRAALEAALKRRRERQVRKLDKTAFALATEEVDALEAANALTELRVAIWAEAADRERTLVGFARLAGISVARAEPLLLGKDGDSLLLVARALDFEERTVLALGRLGGREPVRARADLERYAALSPATAKRVLGLLRRGSRATDPTPAALPAPAAAAASGEGARPADGPPALPPALPRASARPPGAPAPAGPAAKASAGPGPAAVAPASARPARGGAGRRLG